MRWVAAVAVLLVVVVASLALNVYQDSTPKSLTVTKTSTQATTETTTETTTEITTLLVTTSITCIITGQPGGIVFRVLSDSTLMPVAGVSVIAINTPFLCDGSPATSQTVEMFTTNGTAWLPLPSDNNYGYSFIANYLGHTYNFTAHLEPVSLTCVTLDIPSGRTNVTIAEYRSTCS